MKMIRLFFGFFFIFAGNLVWSQSVLNGRILDAQTDEALPFASIQVEGRNGTISNEDGRFRIADISHPDTIDFSYVGYFTKRVISDSSQSELIIRLEPKAFELREFTVRESAFDFAWELVKQIRSSLKGSTDKESKAYIELFTNRYKEPVEIAELYYNARQAKGALQDLKYKTGRIGLMKFGGGYFVSLSSSRVFQELELLNNSSQLPDHPLHMSRREVRSTYDLKVAEYSSNEERAYILYFEPRKTDGSHFSGEVYLQGGKLEKVILYISEASQYPFVPIIPGDSLSNVAMQVEFRFRNLDSGLALNVLRFNYGFNYFLKLVDDPKGLVRTTPTDSLPSYQSSPVISDGFCYFFDFGKPFFEPHYRYGVSLNDYQKILNTPPNPFFWERVEPLLKSERFLEKEAFFKRHGTVNNFTEHDSVAGRMESLFYHKNIIWSDEQRLGINELYVDKERVQEQPLSATPKRYKYNLDVQLYLDYTEVDGEARVVDACVFDIYNSYYRLQTDSLTDAFLNIHFDICEKNRRIMTASIARLDLITPNQVELIYAKTEKQMLEEMKSFIDESDSGSKFEALKKWNERVSIPLGVNNLKIFDLK